MRTLPQIEDSSGKRFIEADVSEIINDEAFEKEVKDVSYTGTLICKLTNKCQDSNFKVADSTE